MEIIKPYYACYIVCIFLLVFTRLNNSFEKQLTRGFVLATGAVLCLGVADMLENYFATLPYPTYGRILCSALGYSLRPAAVYFLVALSVRKSTRRTRLLLAIPLVFNVLVSFSAFFGDWAFSFDAENDFHRGIWGFVPFVVGITYMLMLLLSMIRMFRNSFLGEASMVMVILLLCGMATALEALFVFPGALPTTMAVSLSFYYMFFHAAQNNRDLLTGALLRRRLFLDANKLGTGLTGVISIDFNDMKIINDNHGHAAGDNALKAFAEVVQQTLPRRAELYRTGGDEFVVLFRGMTEEEVRLTVSDLRARMEELPFTFAMGYVMAQEGEKYDHLFLRADAEMYRDKVRMKGEEYRAKYRTSERND